MDPELTEQLAESMKQLSEMMAQLNSTMAGTVKSMGDAANAGRNAANASTQAARQQTESAGNVVTGNNRLSQAQAKAGAIMEDSARTFAKAGMEAGSAIVSFGKALISTEEGFKKYGSAANSFGTAALTLGSNFGILGTAAGLLTKGFGAAAGAVFDQADNLLAASDAVSKLGAANSFSTDELYKMAHSASLTSRDIEKMIKPIQSVTGGFVTMGVTQSEGIRRFGEMINVTAETRNQFRRLGLNDQERIQAQADFISMMNKSGAGFQGSLKTQQGLQKASLDYITNLYELSALTGKDIESTKQQQEINRASYEWKLLENQWAVKKKAAEDAGNTAEVERIEKIQKATARMNDLLAYDPVKQAAFQQRYLTGAVTELSAQFDIMGVPVDRFIEQMKSGVDVSGEFMNSLKTNGQQMTDTFGPTALGLSDDLRKISGLTKEQIQLQTQRMNTDEVEAAKIAKQRLIDNSKGEGPAATDPLQQARNELIIASTKAAQALDDFFKKLQPELINTLTHIIKETFPAFVSVLQFATNNIGYLTTGIGVLAGTAGVGMIAGIFGKLKSAITGIISMFGSLGSSLKGFLGLMSVSGAGAPAAGASGAAGAAGAAGRLGLAGIGKILGKFVLPGAAAAMTAYDAYKGFTADPNASFGGKLANAGKGALSGLTFGLSDYLTGGVTTGKENSSASIEKDKEISEKVKTASDKQEMTSFRYSDTTEKFKSVVESFRLIVANDGRIVEAFGKIVKAFVESVEKFTDFLKVNFVNTTPGTNSKLLDIIAQAEGTTGSNGYNTSLANGAYLPGGKEQNLTEKTLTQVLQLQKFMLDNPKNKFNSSALGRYQITSGSLKDAAKGLGLDLDTTTFNPQIQDQMAMWLAKSGSGLNRWEGLKNNSSLMAAAQSALMNTVTYASNADIVSLGNQLANQGFKISEHTAFGGVTKGAHRGRGHAEGRAIDINVVGGRDVDDPVAAAKLDALAAQLSNNPNFKVLWRTDGHYDHMHVESKLKAARGGVFSGSTGGYPVELHGNEMVAPLNLNSVLMKLAKTSADTQEGQAAMAAIKNSQSPSFDAEKIAVLNRESAAMITDKLDALIDILEDGNDTRQKILQHTR